MTTELIPPQQLSDLVKRLYFLILALKYLFYNDVKTVTASFSSLLNTRYIFAPQVKGESRPRNSL